MVTMNLINTDKENQVVYYHCMPEDKEDGSFDLGLDVVNKKIVSNTLGKRNSYVVHAAYKIYEQYAQTKQIPQSTVSVWY